MKRLLPLLLLMALLPFVSAQSITDVKSFGGTDSVENYMRATDFFTVEVTVDDGTIQPTQVLLGTSPFTSCQSLGTQSTCSVRFPQTGTASFVGEFPFGITLNDDLGNQLDTGAGSIFVDNQRPTVDITTVNPNPASTGDIRFSYTIQDTACSSGSCGTGCAGIESVQFFSTDSSFLEDIGLDSSDCSISDELVVDGSVFGLGDQRLHAIARDRFEQVSLEDSIAFTIEQTAPVLLENTFNITTSDVELTHFGDHPVPVVISIHIEDTDLDFSKVIGDFSELGGEGREDMRAQCRQIDTRDDQNVYRCEWSTQIEVQSDDAIEIVINATDALDNTEGIILTKGFLEDSTGPVINAILSTQGDVYAQPVTDIIAQFTETGIGVLPEQMLLTIGSKPATSCDENQCIWEDVSLSGANVEVGVNDQSTDILGNRVRAITHTFRVSSVVPTQVDDISVIGIGGLTAVVKDFIAIGDFIGIEVNISSTLPVDIVADFGQFTEAEESSEGNCVEIDLNLYTCAVVSDPVTLARDGFVPFNVTDEAGGLLQLETNVLTYDLLENAQHDLWEHSVLCSPTTLDKQLAPLFPQRAYCTVTLSSSQSSVRTAHIQLDGCTGDQNGFLQNAELFHGEIGSTTPLIKLTFAQTDINVDNLKTTCTLSIDSFLGQSVTQAPEKEAVDIDFTFVNLPLGEVSEEVQKEIDEAKDEALSGLNGFIGLLQDIMAIAKKICGLLTVIYDAVTLYYFVTQSMGDSETVTCTSALFGGPCETAAALRQATCGTEQAAQGSADAMWGGFIGTFCGIVNCDYSEGFIGEIQGWTSGMIDQIPGGEYLPGGSLAANMNPQSGLITSALFACIPGVIHHLDRYRQIQCLYADCLQNAVARDNIPISSCKYIKDQAICKYVAGEVFALIPFTNIFDVYMGAIKNALSDPFSALGLAVGAVCWHTCKTPPGTGAQLHKLCDTFPLFSKVGAAIRQVKGIIDQGLFENRQDYCTNLEDEEEEDEEDGGFLGIF